MFREYAYRFSKPPHPESLAILLEDGTVDFYPEGVWIPISEELAQFIRRERPSAHLVHTDFTWKIYAGHHPGLIGRARDLLPELFE